MNRRLWVAIGLAAVAASPALARGGFRGGGGSPQHKPPWGEVVDPVKAAQIALREVCLPAVLDARPIEPFAKANRFVRTPPKTVQAARDDKVWQVGVHAKVYVVARADGSCSALVDSGPADLLGPMAEATILERREGIARGQSGPDDAGHLRRTVYCSAAGDTHVLISVATPSAGAPRGTRPFAATISRTPTLSPLCAVGRPSV